MRVVVVEAPEPIVSLDEAKLHLRVDGDGEDALIAGMVAAATAHIDGPDGWLGRAIGVQTLEARFDVYESVQGLSLPYPPVLSLISFSWIDGDRVEQAGDLAAVELVGSRVTPVADQPWSGLRVGDEVLRVRYRAGYETVPAPIHAAVLLMAEDLYRNRGQVATMTASPAPMQPTVLNLLSPFRVWR